MSAVQYFVIFDDTQIIKDNGVNYVVKSVGPFETINKALEWCQSKEAPNASASIETILTKRNS